MTRASHRFLPLAGTALLAGCATTPPPAPIVALPVAIPTLAPRPAMPQGYAAGYQTPRDPVTGGYVIPANGIGAAEALWHVRAGLNVAALACRESDMAPAYNAMLKRLSAAFTAADGETKRVYRERHGPAWQAAHDTAMTKLYNWYAQPFAHAGFCAAAADALTEVQTLPTERAAEFGTRRVATLARPFLDGYARWDAWRVAEAERLATNQVPDTGLKLDRVAAAR